MIYAVNRRYLCGTLHAQTATKSIETSLEVTHAPPTSAKLKQRSTATA